MEDLIFLISILITSYTVNDKEAFDDMLYEAKKLFSNMTNDPQKLAVTIMSCEK